MTDSNLTQASRQGDRIRINEYSQLDGRTLGDRFYRVDSKREQGNNVVFRLKADGHDFGDREATVDSINRISTQVIMNGEPRGLVSTYNRDGNMGQGGKKKRKTKRKSSKKRKTKRKSLKKRRKTKRTTK